MSKIFELFSKFLLLPLLKDLGSFLYKLILRKIEERRLKKQLEEDLKKAESHETNHTSDTFNQLP